MFLAATLVGWTAERQYLFMAKWQHMVVYNGIQRTVLSQRIMVVSRWPWTFTSYNKTLHCQLTPAVMFTQFQLSVAFILFLHAQTGRTDGQQRNAQWGQLARWGPHNDNSVSAKRSSSRVAVACYNLPVQQVHFAVPGNMNASAVSQRAECVCNHATA